MQNKVRLEDYSVPPPLCFDWPAVVTYAILWADSLHSLSRRDSPK